MTSVNCINSPISSSRTIPTLSSLAPNPKESPSSFSAICFESSLAINEDSVYRSHSNSSQANQLAPNVTPGTTKRFIESAILSPEKRCPVNISLFSTLLRGYPEKTSRLSVIGAAPVSDFIPLNADKVQKMIEGVQSQPTAISNKCGIDDDTRALKLAVELTMINLNKTQSVSTSPTMTTKCHPQSHSQNILPPAGQPYSPLSPYHMTSKVYLQSQSHTVLTSPISLSSQQIVRDVDLNDVSRTNSLTDVSQSLTNSIIYEERSKKSQNMTECVPVPSSEHVAEIVGRQGCKIKALRAKTNTYIKTPVRNEEPVFVVTGRKEDVSKAKHEILSAAEHFTVIRATRRLNDHVVANSAFSGGKQQVLGLYKNSLPPSSQTQGQVTIQVRVPYRLVGLVVGTKGNTIKHIQQETQTYIVTPSRDKEPIFEVTGLADNVELARKHIEIHIATRIGNSQNNSMTTSVSSPSPSPCATVRQSTDADSAESSLQSLNALNQMLNDDLHSEILTSIYKNGICSTLDCSQIGGNIISPDDKCNNLHSLNGFLGDINVAMLNTDDKEIQDSYSLNEHVNNQIKCVDFINNLMDSNVTQFGIEQRSKFT